ncbi:MAG: hypothetical protein JW827_10370 [Spirochaetes bacterium]|nr:hypothetical protein [Spirochaetota bacterium]
MHSNKFMKQWIREKIKYYESLLEDNPDANFRAELEEGIKILKELL